MQDLVTQSEFKKAVSLHQSDNFDQAKKIYKKLLKVLPSHYKLHFLLGALFAQTKEYKDAIKYIKKAISLHPPNSNEHALCYFNLGKIYDEQGLLDDSIYNYKKSIEYNDKNIDAFINCSFTYIKLNKIEDAHEYILQALKLNPNSEMGLNILGNIMFELKNYKKSRDIFELLIKINRNLFNPFLKLGIIYRSLNDDQKALQYLYKAHDINPKSILTLQILTRIFRTINDKVNAIKYTELACKLDQYNFMNLHTLKTLTKEPLMNDEKEFILQNINDEVKINAESKSFGFFLLAENEAKNENLKQEFEYLKSAHQYLYQANVSRLDLNDNLKYQLETIPKIISLFNKLDASFHDYESTFKLKPIFIVGVPRSGSTLLEQIISRSPDKILRTEESGLVYTCFRDLNIMKINNESIKLDLYEASKFFINEFLEMNIENNKHFIFSDKSLGNFFYIGIIKKLFPSAKIINCRRDPFSSIMSIFKNDLANLAWAHSIENIFKYFDNYFKIIKFWEELYPNYIYNINYENLVTNPEQESKKVFDYCSIQWDKKCLEFYKEKNRKVLTASVEQVRHPISDKNLNQYDASKIFLEEYKNQYAWFK